MWQNGLADETDLIEDPLAVHTGPLDTQNERCHTELSSASLGRGDQVLWCANYEAVARQILERSIESLVSWQRAVLAP
jgi:hypothetical protein